ncbi:MAG: hypothetical protein RL318_609 [Fibrobacterota bacterium]|jgi:hypothetical protein
MRNDVTLVKPQSDHRLYVELADGTKGFFDMKPYLGYSAFQELRNDAYFQQAGIFYGVVTWPNEQDIAPETLQAELVPA